MTTKKQERKADDDDYNSFIKSLYDVENINDNEFKSWVQSYSYKGFDREKVLFDLKRKVPDIKICHQIILACGLNGPQRAALVQLQNGKTIESYGIPASGMKGSTGISCQRITAATADLCAYLLKKANAPKRVDIDLPGWLQFPSAGSIKLPHHLRQSHIEFSKKFSIMIGGNYNEQIYHQMVNNSYLDDRLNLF